MTKKTAQIGYRETKKVVEALGFLSRLSVGSHHHFKHPQTGKKITLPFYKKPYSDFLISNIARQAGLGKNRLLELCTNKNSFKKIKRQES